MTLKEFNKILNQEFNKFYKAKNTYIQQKDSDWGFKYKLNVPFIQYKEYVVGSHLFFIGTNNNIKCYIGMIGDNSFRNYFTPEKMSSYLEEEVEIAIIKMAINNHMKSISEIENSDTETKNRWKDELDWHKSEVEKLENIIEELQNSKELDIER